jgi:deoxyadenosine/deoxycytidine kinase
MRQIIAVGGNPGSGKTTLFRAFMEGKRWDKVDANKLLPAMYCKELDLFVLGKYEAGETFAGTDRLSMAVQPMVEEFALNTKSNILFEGDRIFNQSFLEFAAGLEDTELHIIYLDVPKHVLQERYAQRGSNQSATFLKGRETKYQNLLQNFELRPYTTIMLNTNEVEQQEILSRLHTLTNVSH